MTTKPEKYHRKALIIQGFLIYNYSDLISRNYGKRNFRGLYWSSLVNSKNFGGMWMRLHMKAELIAAIEQRCRACRWWDEDDWRSCRTTSCPNHRIAHADLQAMTAEAIQSQLHSICCDCVKNIVDQCHANCPYQNLSFAPTFFRLDKQNIRRIRC